MIFLVFSKKAVAYHHSGGTRVQPPPHSGGECVQLLYVPGGRLLRKEKAVQRCQPMRPRAKRTTTPLLGPSKAHNLSHNPPLLHFSALCRTHGSQGHTLNAKGAVRRGLWGANATHLSPHSFFPLRRSSTRITKHIFPHLLVSTWPFGSVHSSTGKLYTTSLLR